MSGGAAELTRPVPLYMQVVQQLRAQIASGEIIEGAALPSQRQMMTRWSISMQTASKVIGALKTEGLAIPSAGRDTIVAPGAAARIAAAAGGSTQVLDEDSPTRPVVTAVTASKAAAPAHVAEILGLPSGRRALRRTEVHASAGQPSMLVTSWYPPTVADAAPRLAESQPLPAGPLAYITETTGTLLRRADEACTAEAADDATAEPLGITVGTPVLLVRARHYDADGRILQYAETFMPSGLAHSRSFVITRA
jgi:DNA-binding GntR family transcriptional regulator